jgi:hypothetical protein
MCQQAEKDNLNSSTTLNEMVIPPQITNQVIDEESAR